MLGARGRLWGKKSPPAKGRGAVPPRRSRGGSDQRRERQPASEYEARTGQALAIGELVFGRARSQTSRDIRQPVARAGLRDSNGLPGVHVALPSWRNRDGYIRAEAPERRRAGLRNNHHHVCASESLSRVEGIKAVFVELPE